VTMYQLLSQEHGSWSMDTGQLRKASEGNLSVELWVKNQVGWLYLQQHLNGHPVWELMESSCNQRCTGTIRPDGCTKAADRSSG